MCGDDETSGAAWRRIERESGAEESDAEARAGAGRRQGGCRGDWRGDGEVGVEATRGWRGGRSAAARGVATATRAGGDCKAGMEATGEALLTAKWVRRRGANCVRTRHEPRGATRRQGAMGEATVRWVQRRVARRRAAAIERRVKRRKKS